MWKKKLILMSIIPIILLVITLPQQATSVIFSPADELSVSTGSNSNWIYIKISKPSGNDFMAISKENKGYIGLARNGQYIGHMFFVPLFKHPINHNWYMCPLVDTGQYSVNIDDTTIIANGSGTYTCYQYNDPLTTVNADMDVNELKFVASQDGKIKITANVTVTTAAIPEDTGFAYIFVPSNSNFKYAKIGEGFQDFVDSDKVLWVDKKIEFYDAFQRYIGHSFDWTDMPAGTDFSRLVTMGTKKGIIFGSYGYGASRNIFVDPLYTVDYSPEPAEHLINGTVNLYNDSQFTTQNNITIGVSDDSDLTSYSTYEAFVPSFTWKDDAGNDETSEVSAVDGVLSAVQHQFSAAKWATVNVTGGKIFSGDSLKIYVQPKTVPNGGKTVVVTNPAGTVTYGSFVTPATVTLEWRNITLTNIPAGGVDMIYFHDGGVAVINAEYDYVEFSTPADEGQAIVGRWNQIYDPLYNWFIRVRKTTTGSTTTRVYAYNSTDSLNTSQYVDDVQSGIGWFSINVSGLMDYETNVAGLNYTQLRFYSMDGANFSEVRLRKETNDTEAPLVVGCTINDTFLLNNQVSHLECNVTDNIDVDIVNGTVGGVTYDFIKNDTLYYYEFICNQNGTFNWSIAEAVDVAGNYNYTIPNYLITCYIDPEVTFINQSPPDISFTNALGAWVNFTYNITAYAGYDYDSVLMYFRVNTTYSDVFEYRNGTSISGWRNRSYYYNSSDIFKFNLIDGLIYPATYNIGNYVFITTPHQKTVINTSSQMIKIKLFNVSNKNSFGFFEIMTNTSTNNNSNLYYCNSSYTTGNVLTNQNCVKFGTLNATAPYHHIHSSYSSHAVIPFAVNVTTGSIGDVVVTSTSYFIIRGIDNSSGWDVYYITNITRPDTIQTTENTGSSWSNFAGTIDAHLHQYNGSEVLYYYACANDTYNQSSCSGINQDLLDLFGLPPTVPDVYYPSIGAYVGNILIQYTQSVSPNAYPIVKYNITLLDTSYNLVTYIQQNNGASLSYNWDSTLVSDDYYIVAVEACDNQSQCSTGYSEIFMVANGVIGAGAITLSLYYEPYVPTNQQTTIHAVVKGIDGIPFVNASVRIEIDGIPAVMTYDTTTQSYIVYWIPISTGTYPFIVNASTLTHNVTANGTINVADPFTVCISLWNNINMTEDSQYINEFAWIYAEYWQSDPTIKALFNQGEKFSCSPQSPDPIPCRWHGEYTNGTACVDLFIDGNYTFYIVGNNIKWEQDIGNGIELPCEYCPPKKIQQRFLLNLGNYYVDDDENFDLFYSPNELYYSGLFFGVLTSWLFVGIMFIIAIIAFIGTMWLTKSLKSAIAMLVALPSIIFLLLTFTL